MLVQFDRPSESLRQRTLGPWPEDGAVRSNTASASPTSLVAETETKSRSGRVVGANGSGGQRFTGQAAAAGDALFRSLLRTCCSPRLPAG